MNKHRRFLHGGSAAGGLRPGILTLSRVRMFLRAQLIVRL